MCLTLGFNRGSRVILGRYIVEETASNRNHDVCQPTASDTASCTKRLKETIKAQGGRAIPYRPVSTHFQFHSNRDTLLPSINSPGFESHQCLAGMWKRRLGCHAGHQEVGRCRTRGESQGMYNVTRMPLLSLNKVEPTLALKPRGRRHQKSETGVSMAQQKKLMSSKIPSIKKKFFTNTGFPSRSI